MKNKETLLDTPMNKLGLGARFNNYFYTAIHIGKRLPMEQEHVITLRELIEMNQEFKTNAESFITIRPTDIEKKFNLPKFSKIRTAWHQLRHLLVDNEFDYNDWIHLLPKIPTSRGLRPNFSLLKKEVLLRLNIHYVTDLQRRGPEQDIETYLRNTKNIERDGDMTVKDIISLSESEIRDIIKKYGAYSQKIGRTFLGMQNKFKQYKLTKKDGSFMKADLSEYDYIA